MTDPEPAYPDPTRRALITIATLLAVMMTTLDGTIAVIALPHIASNLSGSQEQIAWVLTSYLIGSAISTPPSGWLADRYGRRRVMASSVAVFTLASIGCGMSGNLTMLVVFRFIQGAAGASLVPLSQVVLLNINPPERQGPAIAMFGIGTLVGPAIGPTLGGWLTDSVSWRAIFLINAPIGLAAFLGLVLFLKDKPLANVRGFDFKGFVAVSLALAAFQLMLDRGQMQDWFASPEIRIEATAAALFAWLAIVHMLTTPEPFIKLAIFRDRNFLLGSLIGTVIGVFLVGVVPIVTTMMQQLLGYPVMLTGILSAPRALGNILTVFVVGRMVSRIDTRLVLLFGLGLLLASLYLLSTMSLDTGDETLAMVAFLQGCGSGFVFLPLTLVVFSTLPADFRNEGSVLFALTRNLGAAAGISAIEALTIRDAAKVQSRLVEHLRPDNPLLGLRMPDLDLSLTRSVATTLGEITRQATMVAYVDSYRMLLGLALVMLPLCLLLRSSAGGRAAAGAGLPAVHVE
ncbi:MAG: DHA2 family efflux MFS transporter permease subunit [Sphingomonadales bacterium]|nr:DHA2 family efflux MFS transporter permease subunit [Sphingomonadales bacterium]